MPNALTPPAPVNTMKWVKEDPGGIGMGARNGRASNRLTNLDKLPVFGELPTAAEFIRLFDGLDLEMIRCTRTTPEDSAANTVNILHASPYIDSSEVEITRMVNFIKSRGFLVKRESRHKPPDWHHADVLVLGTDDKRLPNLKGVLDTLVYRIGLVQGWDVLLYGTKSRVTTESIPPERPLCSGPRFGFDGMCVLHGHIVLRDDVRFWEGFFAYMAIELETYIDRVISRPAKNLYCKLNRLESDFKEANLHGDDAELFLAAAHLIRSLRNAFVHSQRNMSVEERRKRGSETDRLFLKFGDMASAKRNSLLLGIDAYVESPHGQIKYFTRIALIARRWAYDLSKMVEPGRRV